jgi:hypothetical protein
MSAAEADGLRRACWAGGSLEKARSWLPVVAWVMDCIGELGWVPCIDFGVWGTSGWRFDRVRALPLAWAARVYRSILSNDQYPTIEKLLGFHPELT